MYKRIFSTQNNAKIEFHFFELGSKDSNVQLKIDVINN